VVVVDVIDSYSLDKIIKYNIPTCVDPAWESYNMVEHINYIRG
jgi:hypothetical protein